MSEASIIVVGGGFSGLKLVKLLKSSSGRSETSVTLVTDSDSFVFLPLTPDYISGKIKTVSGLTTNITEFCRHLDVNCVIEKCVDIDSEEKKVVCQSGASIPYDKCIVCTGTTTTGNHTRIWSLLESLGHEIITYNTGKMGLAEFEIMSALEEANLDVTLINYGKHKDLNGHWLRNTLAKNGLNARFKKVSEYIQDNSISIYKDSPKETSLRAHSRGEDIIVIGAALTDLEGGKPSAQRSSHDAHVVAFCINENRTGGKSLIKEVRERLNQYKPRGEMIYIHSECALLWLGNRLEGKATLSGLPASLVRRIFYRIEFWLYYQTRGAPRLLCRFANRTRMYKWC